MHADTAERTVAALVAGHRAIVITADPQHAILQVAEDLLAPHHGVQLIRSRGREEVRHRSGGRARFLTGRQVVLGSHRGISADVLILDAPVSEDWLIELLPCTATSLVSEVYRAEATA